MMCVCVFVVYVICDSFIKGNAWHCMYMYVQLHILPFVILWWSKEYCYNMRNN